MSDLEAAFYGSSVEFPDVSQALEEPNGLLAVGGQLEPETLLQAYRQGIFPWYSEGQPILWWSPDPRMVLYPAELRVSRSLRRTRRRGAWRVSMDEAFPAVIKACAGPRLDDSGTWITPAILTAYIRLHELGWAHSVEVWWEGQLAGGLYGIAIGQVFFGESMFHHVRDASKLALVSLVRQLQSWDFRLIDCQVASPHLSSLGAREIPRRQFIDLLKRWGEAPQRSIDWRFSG